MTLAFVIIFTISSIFEEYNFLSVSLSGGATPVAGRVGVAQPWHAQPSSASFCVSTGVSICLADEWKQSL